MVLSEFGIGIRTEAISSTLVNLPEGSMTMFIVSFGCGILFRDWLDANMIKIGNAPFGFWMAQQGSIICFVLLLIAYNILMNRLDAKFGYEEGEDA